MRYAARSQNSALQPPPRLAAFPCHSRGHRKDRDADGSSESGEKQVDEFASSRHVILGHRGYHQKNRAQRHRPLRTVAAVGNLRAVRKGQVSRGEARSKTKTAPGRGAAAEQEVHRQREQNELKDGEHQRCDAQGHKLGEGGADARHRLEDAGKRQEERVPPAEVIRIRVPDLAVLSDELRMKDGIRLAGGEDDQDQKKHHGLQPQWKAALEAPHCGLLQLRGSETSCARDVHATPP